MKKILSPVLAAVLILTWSTQSFATAVTATRANDANDLTAGAAFDNLGAWTLTVADDANFTTGVVTTAGNGGANAGTVTFAGSTVINTAASANVLGAAGAALLAVNAGIAGETVTINGDTFATTFTVTGTGTVNADAITGTTLNYAADGILSLDTGENITAAITNTTTNNGTLTLEGAHTITGDIGSTGAGLKLITAGNGAVVTTGNILATTLNFAGDNSLTLATTKSITGAVTTTTTNTGTLIMTDVGTVTGTVGSSAAALKLITLSGAGAKAITGNVFATTTNFGSTGTLTMSDNASINGLVSTSVAAQGNLTFSGTSTVSGAIGTNALYLNNITANGAGETLTFGGNVFATDFSQGAANTLNIGANTIDLNGAADGDFTLNGTGTLALTINSASVFGNVLANGGTGDVTLASTNTVSITVAGAVANGQTFTVINGDAGIASLPTITDNSVFLSFTATEPSAGDLLLTTTLNTSGVATTTSSSATLTAIDNALATGAGSDLTSVANTLYSVSTSAEATAALETMDPIVNAGVNAASFTAVNQSIGALNAHLSEAPSQETAPQTGVSTGDFWKDNGIWVKGYGSHADQDARGGVNGYKANLWGALGGIDGIVSENTRLGFAGGYANTDVSNKIEGGGTDIDSIQGTVYLGYDDPSPWYGNAGFSFGWNMYDGSRNIAIGSTIARTALSDYDGQQYTGFGELGYVIEYETVDITPIAGLVYSHLDLDGYTETNAGDLNLIVRSQGYDLLQSSLGVKIAMPLKGQDGLWDWTPEVHAKWLYDFIGDEAATNATFAGGGSSFATRGADPAQHSFNAGAGATFFSQGNVTITATYDFEAKEDYTSHTGQGVVRYSF